MIITYPERVTTVNIERMRKYVLNGPNYPGARVVRSSRKPWPLVLEHMADRRKVAQELSVGDIVERHLLDGDCVLFNRQPSLHRMSIMCHRARVLEWRTLRFNEVRSLTAHSQRFRRLTLFSLSRCCVACPSLPFLRAVRVPALQRRLRRRRNEPALAANRGGAC